MVLLCVHVCTMTPVFLRNRDENIISRAMQILGKVDIKQQFLGFNYTLRAIPNEKKKTIHDLFVVNRAFLVTIHDKKITNHDTIFFSFSLKN